MLLNEIATSTNTYDYKESDRFKKLMNTPKHKRSKVDQVWYENELQKSNYNSYPNRNEKR